MKQRIQVAWADYCFDCDRSRYDEALAIVGAFVVGLIGVWILGVLLAVVLAGQEIYGVPLMAVACWTRRGLRA